MTYFQQLRPRSCTVLHGDGPVPPPPRGVTINSLVALVPRTIGATPKLEHAPRRRPAPWVSGVRLSPRSLQLLLTAVTVAAVAGAVHTFVVAPLTGQFTRGLGDLSVYLTAGRAANAGTNPYAGFSAATMTLSGFIYPPLDAWLFRPLALLPSHVAQILWLWLELASMVGGTVLVARTLLPRSCPSVRLGVSAALLFGPATDNLWLGQVNPLIFMLLALALHAWVRGREGRCGILLGVAAAVKLAPLMLVVLFLRRRWWRGALALLGTALVATAAGVILVGVGPARTFVTTVWPALNRDNGWVGNESWNGVLSRLADHAVFAGETPSSAVHLGSLLLGTAGLLWAAWAVRPGDRARELRGVEFGGGVAAMLLSGSVTWISHDIHLLIPLFAAIGLVAARGRRAPRAVWGALIAAIVGLGVLTPVLIANSSMSSLVAASHDTWWWLQLQLWSVPALASVLLLVALVTAAGSTALPGYARANASHF